MYDDDKLIKIFGTNELVQAFKDLDSDLNNKMLMTSFTKAGKLLMDEIRGNLVSNRRSGRLYNSITSEFRKEQKRLVVGASRRKGAYHAHLLEYGTKSRIKANGASTGQMKGTRYFGRAVFNTTDEVFKIIQVEVKNSIDKYIKN